MKCVELHPTILSLDTDVGLFVPELAIPRIITGFSDDENGTPILKAAENKITLRMLLTHTSGLAYEATSPLLLKWKQHEGKELFVGGNFTGMMAPYEYPLVFEPGESWCYGPGVDWAGRVVEAVSGKSLEDFLKSEVWEKLDGGVGRGMSFRPGENVGGFEGRKVEMLSKDSKTGEMRKLDIEKEEQVYPTDAKDCLGGIGLFSSPKSFIAILEMLLKGGDGILQQESVDEIFRNQIDNPDVLAYVNAMLNSDFMVQSGMKASLTKGKRIDVGLGNFIGFDHEEKKDGRGGRGEGTISGMGLPNSTWWVDRERGVAGAVFFQCIPPLDRVLAGVVGEVESAFYGGL